MGYLSKGFLTRTTQETDINDKSKKKLFSIFFLPARYKRLETI